MVALTGIVHDREANAFSAGFDLKAADSWPSEPDDLKRRQRAYGGVRLCKAWETMPAITIAAMEKLAVGAGVAIALACDWRVLARDAYLYVPEVKIGLNLQWGALPRLITLVGPARAKRITIMCEKMPAGSAPQWRSARHRLRCGIPDKAVASALHHAPMMQSDGRIDQIAAERAQPRKRPLLVSAGKLAVTGYIRREDGCKFPGLRHGSPFTTRQSSTINRSGLVRGLGDARSGSPASV